MTTEYGTWTSDVDTSSEGRILRWSMNEFERGFIIGCKDIRIECRAMHASRAQHTWNLSVRRNISGELQANCVLHYIANSVHRQGKVHEMDFEHIWNVSLRTLYIRELVHGSHTQIEIITRRRHAASHPSLCCPCRLQQNPPTGTVETNILEWYRPGQYGGQFPHEWYLAALLKNSGLILKWSTEVENLSKELCDGHVEHINHHCISNSSVILNTMEPWTCAYHWYEGNECTGITESISSYGCLCLEF